MRPILLSEDEKKIFEKWENIVDKEQKINFLEKLITKWLKFFGQLNPIWNT